MLTQFRVATDAIATYISKEFGEVAGLMTAQAVRTRQEPVGNEPNAPVGDTATSGSVEMIKWKVFWENYNKKSKEWKQQINLRIFNLLCMGTHLRRHTSAAREPSGMD